MLSSIWWCRIRIVNWKANMTNNLPRWVSLLAMLGLLVPPSSGAEPVASAPAAKPVVPPAPAVVIYRAAKGSAPSGRLTGGSRGSGSAAVSLDVLAPEQIGLTTQEQPSLFWYQSKPSTASFELTVLEPNRIQPLLQIHAAQATNSGIQRLRLSDHGVKLAPGVEYQWVIALVSDPENRSTDLVASGFIQRVEPSAELQAKVAAASLSALPAIYAEAGIWHDALGQLSDLIDAQPTNASLPLQRAELFRQVGLKKIALAEGAPAPR